jgi:hypothetical protein
MLTGPQTQSPDFVHIYWLFVVVMGFFGLFFSISLKSDYEYLK